MGSALLIISILAVIVATPSRPHIAVCAYYVMSILAPQAIWPWVFEGIPAFQLTAGTVLLAFVFSLLTKKIDLQIYKHKQNVLLALLFLLVNLSNWLSPFKSFSAATSAELVLDTFNTIILLYFVSLPFLATEAGLKWAVGVFIATITYYVYWSNLAYLSYDMSKFNQGRLMGPMGSPYRDENKFAVLFVVGAPFLLFGAAYLRSSIQKLVCGAVLLLTWHSIFLTGSRGALLATVVSTLFAAKLIKSEKLGWLLVAVFAIVVVDQGAESFGRTSETIAAAQEEEDKPIDPRISSWTAGMGFMIEHPLLGVGVQRFQEATREYYPDRLPYVAHNTLIDVAAENGLIAGGIFLYLYWMHFTSFIKSHSEPNKLPDIHEYLNNACITSLTGFYVSSMFLDMLIYEVFYFLLLVMFANSAVCSKEMHSRLAEIEVIKRMSPKE